MWESFFFFSLFCFSLFVHSKFQRVSLFDCMRMDQDTVFSSFELRKPVFYLVKEEQEKKKEKKKKMRM